jgi:hypothetical protein
MENAFFCSLYLVNSGGAPAQNIDVHLHFPDGMDIFDTKHLPPEFQTPVPPEPPRKPRSWSEYITESLNIGIAPAIFNRLGNYNMEVPNVSSPTIQKSFSYDVDYDVTRLKHGYQECLGELLIVFNVKQSVKSFHAEYIVTADNLPFKQSGRLNFVVLDKVE